MIVMVRNIIVSGMHKGQGASRMETDTETFKRPMKPAVLAAEENTKNATMDLALGEK